MSKAKSMAKERDGQICQFCSITNEQHNQEYGRGLHAHHIIKDRDGGKDRPENYLTVCRDCHNLLEQTQAEALSRIKAKHTEEVGEQLLERVEELEREQREETEHKVFAWLEDSSVEQTILVKGLVTPDIETYSDREEAAQEFVDYDGQVEMRTTTVSIGDKFQEELRIASTGNIELHTNKTDAYFVEKETVDNKGFSSFDIPEELE